jgi:hypothetical protein
MGRMIPIEFEISNKGTKIHFVCVDCKKEHRNKASSDDDMVSLNSESQKRQKRRIEKEKK